MVERWSHPGRDQAVLRSRLVRLLVAISALGAFAGASSLQSARAASTSASLSASVPVVTQFKSLTISAANVAFGSCTGGSSSGSTLGYPNGTCATPSYTLTNSGSQPEGLDVAGSNAAASDGGAGWTLVSTNLPGTDQYALTFPSFLPGFYLTASAQCDPNLPGCATGGNSLAGGSAVNETVHLIGPTAASDAAATSFSSSITYTAV